MKNTNKMVSETFCKVLLLSTFIFFGVFTFLCNRSPKFWSDGPTPVGFRVKFYSKLDLIRFLDTVDTERKSKRIVGFLEKMEISTNLSLAKRFIITICSGGQSWDIFQLNSVCQPHPVLHVPPIYTH